MKNISELEQLIQAEKFNGAISVVKEDALLLSRGFGYANLEYDVPNTENTKFRIASITKQFTACAIMQLHENKLINPHDAINTYLNDYPNGNQITIHNLLTHTSGIANFDLDQDFFKVIHAPSVQSAVIDLFKNLPLQFEPGSNFSYSVSGYFLLGEIIERVSGLSYEAYLEKNIFKPIQLHSTGFDHAQNIVKNRATPYEIYDGQLINAPFFDMRIAGAGGGLYSSISDLNRFNDALLSEKVISKNALKSMFDKNFIITDEVASGYGIFLEHCNHMGKTRRRNYHAGGGIGVRSMNLYYPDDHLRITLVSNVNDREIFNEVLEASERFFLEIE